MKELIELLESVGISTSPSRGALHPSSFPLNLPLKDGTALRLELPEPPLISHLDPDDLLVLAVSGGASALLSAPASPVALKDKQATTDLLLRAGANIHDLNTVRKQLSFLK